LADERARRRSSAWYRDLGVPAAAMLVTVGAAAVLMTFFLGWFPVALLFWFVVLPKLGMRGCGSRRRWQRYDYHDSSHPMSAAR
jgi:hypothetical protein